VARAAPLAVVAVLLCACAPALGAARGPGLNAIERIATARIDSGTGVYPALTSTDRLAVPDQEALAHAVAWAHTRGTVVSFAVSDPGGNIVGFQPDRRFRSASLTKAMVLVAFLRRADAERRAPTEAQIRSLGYMIRISDNASADAIYRATGDTAMRVLALDAGMRNFAIAGDWANATVTAADQARFFARLDLLIPRRYARLAFGLLETVAPFHSWGIPAVARSRWRVFFKGGWRPGGSGSVVHQAALLQSGGRRIGLAVMTEDNADETAGHATIAGIAARLLGGPGVRAVPVGPNVLPGRLAPIGDLRGVRAPEPPRFVSLRDAG
jgi:hypothetical protein